MGWQWHRAGRRNRVLGRAGAVISLVARADLQVLKLEIGGDAAQSDGAEPAVEHAKGQIDCNSGFGWWLAEQAVARNPNITLMGLQWSAPGWVGSTIWDPADIGFVIDWLNCAKSHISAGISLTCGRTGPGISESTIPVRSGRCLPRAP